MGSWTTKIYRDGMREHTARLVSPPQRGRQFVRVLEFLDGTAQLTGSTPLVIRYASASEAMRAAEQKENLK